MTEKPSKPKRPRKQSPKVGRPAYRPTIESRQIVEEMKFCGESDNTIARALGIDPDTLRKHFKDELADGHAQRRREVIGMIFKSAREGNVAAQKKLEEMGRSREPGLATPQTAPPRGKKEERQAAAEAVASGPSRFAPPPPPKLVVSN